MARDKRRKVSSAEIKFSDESVTTIQFRPRKKNARCARSWRNARVPVEKFLEKRGSAFNDRKRNVRAALEEFD